MIRAVAALALGIAAALAPFSAGRAATADIPYALFVDGRPLDARTPSGLAHRGIVFVNVVRAVKTFDGLLSFLPAQRVRVTISGRTLDFRTGSPYAFAGTTRVRLPAAPFVENGDTYVPLQTIASLASAKIAVDRVRHRVNLSLAPLAAFAPTPVPAASNDDLAPSPALALAVVTTGRSDATGLHVRADIANRTGRPYGIAFPTQRQIEFVVARNGSAVWSSLDVSASAAPASDAAASTFVVPARGTRSVSADWPGYAKAGPGRYTLRVRLLTTIPLDEPPISLDAPQQGASN